LSSNSSTKKKEVLFGFLLIKLHRAVLRQHWGRKKKTALS
jgi:hypothetical protein